LSYYYISHFFNSALTFFKELVNAFEKEAVQCCWLYFRHYCTL